MGNKNCKPENPSPSKSKSPSSFSSSCPGGKRNAPNGLEYTFNHHDRKLILPEEYKATKKDICQYIRNLYEYEYEDSIQPAINLHCTIEGILNSIFKDMNQDDEFFPVRIYISTQFPKNYFLGVAAKFLNEVGFNHLAVQIGKKIVHWFDSSLVYVHDFHATNCIAILYPQQKGIEKPQIENTRENKLAICKVIQRWNCEITYSGVKNNCQKFVKDIFEALNLDNKFSQMEGPVADFINYIADPSNKQTFPCIVQGNKKMEEWKSHHELDVHSQNNLEEIYNSQFSFLIMGFHRAFQAKKEMGLSQCPFGGETLNYEKEKAKVEGEEKIEGGNFLSNPESVTSQSGLEYK